MQLIGRMKSFFKTRFGTIRSIFIDLNGNTIIMNAGKKSSKLNYELELHALQASQPGFLGDLSVSLKNACKSKDSHKTCGCTSKKKLKEAFQKRLFEFLTELAKENESKRQTQEDRVPMFDENAIQQFDSGEKLREIELSDDEFEHAGDTYDMPLQMEAPKKSKKKSPEGQNPHSRLLSEQFAVRKSSKGKAKVTRSKMSNMEYKHGFPKEGTRGPEVKIIVNIVVNKIGDIQNQGVMEIGQKGIEMQTKPGETSLDAALRFEFERKI